jgi:hypothetical protein
VAESIRQAPGDQNPKDLDCLQREDAATFVYKTVINLSGSLQLSFGVTESFAPNPLNQVLAIPPGFSRSQL